MPASTPALSAVSRKLRRVTPRSFKVIIVPLL
jgi:hypothetical protein